MARRMRICNPILKELVDDVTNFLEDFKSENVEICELPPSGASPWRPWPRISDGHNGEQKQQ